MRAFLAAAALLVLGAAGCQKPVVPPVNPDAAHATCDTACGRLTTLGCQFAAACPANCANIGSGTYNDCLVAAASCSAASACDRP